MPGHKHEALGRVLTAHLAGEIVSTSFHVGDGYGWFRMATTCGTVFVSWLDRRVDCVYAAEPDPDELAQRRKDVADARHQ